MGNKISEELCAENGDTEMVEVEPFLTSSVLSVSFASKKVFGEMFKQPISATREIAEKRWKSRYFKLVRGGILYYSLNSIETHTLSQVR